MVSKILHTLLLSSTLLLTSCAKYLEWSGLETGGISGRLLSQFSISSLETSTSAVSCASPTATLYKLDEDGERVSPDIDTTTLKADGTYTFNAKRNGVLFQNGAPVDALMVEVKGCDTGSFSRPVTSMKNQDISPGSTLVGYLLNTSDKDKVVEALNDSKPRIEALIQNLSSATDLQSAYDLLATNMGLNNEFNSVFNIASTALTTSSPSVTSFTIPATGQELSSIALTAEANHWLSTYTKAYRWELDGVLLGTASSYTWNPNGNTQGTHTITLKVGESDGAGGIDSSKPITTISRSITISNNVPPSSPSFEITTPSVSGTTPIGTRTLTLTIDTGPGRVNCGSFAAMAFTEENATPPAPSDFTINCTQANSQNVSATLASANDGVKTIRLWTIDSANNISSSPTSVTVYLDTGIPSATIATTPAALSNQTSLNFSFSADDNGGVVDHLECQLDAEAFSACSSPKSLTSLTQGSHTFSVRAIDSAGNISPVDSKIWIVDLAAPIISLTSTPSAVTNNVSSTFVFSATDAGGGAVAGFNCQIDGGSATACVSPYVTGLTAGSHSITILASDTAGNTSAPTTYSWIIDSSAPVAAIVSQPAALTNSQTANFTISATDSGGGSVASYECQLDGGGFSGCTTTPSYTSLAAGSHTFQVRATDTAANTSAAVSYTWTIDLTTPMASINSNPPSITNSATGTFTFSATPPPAGSITGYECNLDSGGYSACSSPKVYTSLTQGSHTFSVRSIDNNSNASSSVSYTWIVDLTNPVLTINTNPTNPTNAANAAFTFSATDTGGGSVASYECKLDAASYAACASPLNYSSLTDGSHTFNVRAIDTAGNTSSVGAYTWVVDLNPPVPTIGTKPSAITNATTANFTFSATDASGTIASYSCSLDGAAATTCTSPLSYTTLAPGSHSFALTATDNSGNTSTATTHNWTIDTTAPVVTISANPVATTNLTTAGFTFSGTDTGGGSVASYQCKLDAAAYAACTSPTSLSALAAGSHTYLITATDTAGNVSTAASYTWTVDITPPTVAITTPSANGTFAATTGLASYAIAGTCSENGRSVAISGSITGSVTCSSGAWSTNINLSALADGVVSLTATHTDVAGNSTSSAARTLTKDTVVPVINVTSPIGLQGNGSYGNLAWTMTELNAGAASNFTVEIYNGTAWSSVGTKAATAGANSNTAYTHTSFSVPNVNVTTGRLRVSYTDASGNSTTTTTGNFPIQSTLPSVTAFSIAQGATSALRNIQIGMSATDSMSNITHFCILLASTAPNSSNSCWMAVNAPSPGVTASQNITFSGFYYALGFTSGNYTLHAFVKNSLGIISALSNSGAGTDATDRASVFYTSPQPPVVENVIASNTDAPENPVNAANYVVAANGNVYIKWKATDSNGFNAGAIAIEYTLDGKTFTSVATGLNNASNGGCTADSGATTLDNGNTGCYVWSGGAPSDYFAIRVRATNSSSLASSSLGNFLNPGNITILAGNLDTGLNGTAKSALIKVRKGTSRAITHQFAVLPDGKILIIDQLYGLVMINPTDGVYALLIPKGASVAGEGDGGPVSSAKLLSPAQLTIDYLGNIYIWDHSRIRKITTSTNPWTINTIIGGGASNDGTNIPGTSLNIPDANGEGWSRYFSTRPDGTLWFVPYQSYSFQSNPRPYLYSYSPDTGNVTNHGFFGGVGSSSSSTVDISNAFLSQGRLGISFDPSTSLNTVIIGDVYPLGYTRFNPTTFMANPSDPLAYPYGVWSGHAFTGLDGNIYMINRSGYVVRWNGSGSNTIIAGNGTGYCIDGTLATSCKMNVDDAFVDANGKLYFLANGLIRTLDNSNNVITLAGQTSSYGDGFSGKDARFGTIKSLVLNNSGDVFTLDSENLLIRKWTRSSKLMSLIAGQNGMNSTPDLTNLANVQGITNDTDIDTAMISINKSSGEILYHRYSSVAKLSSSTGKWVDIAGSGSTNYASSSDGAALNVINMRPNYYPKVVGANNTSILVSLGAWIPFFGNGMLKTYDLTTGYQTHFAGITGNVDVNFPADNTVLATSLYRHNERHPHMVYDTTSDAWYTYSTNSIKKLVQGGTITSLVTDTGVSDIRAVSLTRKNGFIVAYYCGSISSVYKLRKWEEETNTFTTLAWPSSSIQCLGNTLEYYPTIDSLVFGFSLSGGLQGIAEYKGP